MYSVLLADNQPGGAEAVERILRRASDPVEIVGWARSGRDAIEKALQLRPDIVVLELGLPGISGLEAIRQIRRASSGIRFIIVSALDYFNYAAEAMSAGADEYLLKPVSETALLEALHRTARKIDAGRESVSQTLSLKEKLDTALKALESAFLSTICLPDGREEECGEYLWLFEIPQTEVYIAAIEFLERDDAREIDTQDEIRKLHPVFRDILKSMCRCLAGAAAPNRLIVLVFDDPAVGPADQRRRAVRLMQTFMGRVESLYPHLHAGLGDPAGGGSPAQIRRSCREALYALERAERRHGACLHFGELGREPVPTEGAARPERAPEGKQKKSNEIIEKADRFMETHFGSEITLEDIAKACALSPFYFSHFYKQETGRNFSQKLTQLRLQKARELLTRAELPIKDVSAAAGYVDPNYFSKIFKKSTGFTPSEYKRHGTGRHEASNSLPQDNTNYEL